MLRGVNPNIITKYLKEYTIYVILLRTEEVFVDYLYTLILYYPEEVMWIFLAVLL